MHMYLYCSYIEFGNCYFNLNIYVIDLIIIIIY